MMFRLGDRDGKNVGMANKVESEKVVSECKQIFLTAAGFYL